ncbi:MAG TPA: glycosyltransferase family 2 protein [Acetobacteraceae bacterium]|nr:glycosyltransferase family 2 protein [Acetobacteraceae bacterium]
MDADRFGLAQGELVTRTVAVVIPCYRVKKHILPLIAAIGPEVGRIYVVDDKCPEQSGLHVEAACTDPRVTILFHAVNQGVGGAVVTGYLAAIADGADVVIKLDGDGQMNPALIPLFVGPILSGRADYVKGNRFYNIEDLRSMPRVRLFGNAVLSFMVKLSSGYWNIFDVTNGYTAIDARVLAQIPLEKLASRYFFESDFLFRLGTVNACVIDLPMTAVYADEESGLKIGRILVPFLAGNVKNTFKRLFYGYFLRGFSIASVELVIGVAAILFGMIFGADRWIHSAVTGTAATTGTVMLAALPIVLGVQLLLSFLAFDFAAVPSRAISPLLNPVRARLAARAAERPVERTVRLA